MTQPKYAESRACDDAVPHDAHTWLDWSETLDGTFGDPPPAEYACPGVTPASAATERVRYLPLCRLPEPHQPVDHNPIRAALCECPCHGTGEPWWSPPPGQRERIARQDRANASRPYRPWMDDGH